MERKKLIEKLTEMLGAPNVRRYEGLEGELPTVPFAVCEWLIEAPFKALVDLMSKNTSWRALELISRPTGWIVSAHCDDDEAPPEVPS
jgi:hypothetical protein